MRGDIRFLRRGRPVRLTAASPTLTLLDYLRLQERATGTKEGCAEGDCGACTVVLRRLRGERVVYEPVNACILLAGQADGAEVITVEDLADGDTLHPVQQALVDRHGSQCGFCTPGFVMALFALYHAPAPRALDRARVNDWLAGNLCRCTGYRPIVEAALASCAGAPSDRFAAQEEESRHALQRLAGNDDLFVGTPERFFAAPTSLAALGQLCAEHPDATLVAGATDVGLWITKGLRDLPRIIWLGRVRGLDVIDDGRDAVGFGACVTLVAATPHLAAIDPDLGELMRRFAGTQIRTTGTVGGNIANGSPIGDLPPALIALGATVALQHGETPRSLPLESFFLAYRKQDRREGEFVRMVRVPKLAANERFRCFKITKRFDEDISAVMGAFKLRLDGRRIVGARLAYGGMAEIPKRARAAERQLIEVSLDRPESFAGTLAALAEDFTPISDQRASARYRLDVARAILRRALTEIAGAPTSTTRIVGRREAVHDGAG
ncbi:MAG: xanthine dehydrogenase small subunit [Bradyrhizobiaceae bacterium]|nr:MAG: xanthine dehydrogenase small subunit [Bradyrhizobiaceae bacterium]